MLDGSYLPTTAPLFESDAESKVTNAFSDGAVRAVNLQARAGSLILNGSLTLDCGLTSCNEANVENTIKTSVTSVNGLTPDITGATGSSTPNYCNPDPCNGKDKYCFSLATTYSCVCRFPYEGTNCTEATNFCATEPCVNGGSCVNRDPETAVEGRPGYTCNCLNGFVGTNCETDKDFCLDEQSNPRCRPGNCTEVNNSDFTCQCPAGVSNDDAVAEENCLLDTNECATNPCVNGVCTESRQGLPLNTYKCTCEPGYQGVNCDEESNPCDENPCLNSGNCIRRNNTVYECECGSGYLGDNCEQIDPDSTAAENNKNQCNVSTEVSICAVKSGNGGLGVLECRDLIDDNNDTETAGIDYLCICSSSYDGDHCERRINKPLFPYPGNAPGETSDSIWQTPGNDASLKVHIGDVCMPVFAGCFNDFYISDNGLITFGGALENPPVRQKQQFPYTSQPNSQLGIVAAASVDMRGEGDSPGATKGIVYYKVLVNLQSGVDTNAEFDDMKSSVVANLPDDVRDSINPTHIIVVTWFDFAHNDDGTDASNTQRMRIQAAVVSDASSQQSFAIFNYEEAGLRNKNWAIGAQSGNSLNINLGPNDPRIDVFNWLELGNYEDIRSTPRVYLPENEGTTVRGRITLDVTEALTNAEVSKAQFLCYQWIETQEADNSLKGRLNAFKYHCPCSTNGATGQLSKEGSQLWTSVSEPVEFLSNTRDNCYLTARKSNKFTLECCYDEDNTLITDPLKFASGSIYKNYPTDPNWVMTDGKPKVNCFTAGLLSEYYKYRPIDDCTEYVPVRIGACNGDPHITTLDGLEYTVNGIGEYWLVNSVDAGKDYSVKLQGRFERVILDPEAVEEHKKYGLGSQYTGVALLDTIPEIESHFQFLLTEDRKDFVIKAGTQDITDLFKAATDGQKFDHPAGEAKFTRLTSSSIQYVSERIDLTVTTNLTIDGAPISIIIGPIPDDFESYGLLGHYVKTVKDSSDDFFARYPTANSTDASGTDPVVIGNYTLKKLPFNINTTTEREFLAFAVTWRVEEDASLFQDLNAPPAIFLSPTYKNFVPVFWEDVLRDTNLPKFASACTAACTPESCDISKEKRNCIFDGVSTNNTAFGLATEQTSAEQAQEVEDAANTVPTVNVDNIIQVVLNVPKVIPVNVFDADGDSVTVTVGGTTGLTGATAVYDSENKQITLTVTNTNANVDSLSVKVSDGKSSAPTVDLTVLLCACENSGTCLYDSFNSQLRFQVVDCDCTNAVGWTGPFCADDENGCASEPCGEFTPGVDRNCTDVNATQQALTGQRYECSPCADNYIESGTKCVDINECNPQDTASGFTYTPENCDQTCENVPGTFKCSCWAGFQPLDEASATCRNVDECSTGVAECEQICTDLTPSFNGDVGFNCSCRAGYTLNADNQTCTQDASVEQECRSLNCSDICAYGANTTTVQCFCPIGQTLGNDNITCTPVNECDTGAHQCLTSTGAQCVDKAVLYECRCPAGFLLNADKLSCSACPQGTWGENCAGICLNCAGACNVSYGCVNCLPGFVSPAGEQNGDCTVNVDECNSTAVASLGVTGASCPSFSECRDSIGSYTCQCLTGYVKNANTSSCDIRQLCTMSTCLNGGACGAPVLNDVQCICATGFTGKTCETNINDCASEPCVNNATCVDKVADYSCTCPPGWAGRNCSDDVNECLEKPCRNDGNCSTPVFGTFLCSCPEGTSGDICQFGGATTTSIIDGIFVVPFNLSVGNDLAAVLPSLVRSAIDSDFNESVTNVQVNNARNHSSNSYTLIAITLTYYQSCAVCSGAGAANAFTTSITEAAGYTALAYFLTGDTDRCTIDNPCKNESLCFSGVNRYQCVCAGNFTGTNCDMIPTTTAATTTDSVTTAAATTTAAGTTAAGTTAAGTTAAATSAAATTTAAVTANETTTQGTTTTTVVTPTETDQVFNTSFRINLDEPCNPDFENPNSNAYESFRNNISTAFDDAMKNKDDDFKASTNWKFTCVTSSATRRKRQAVNSVDAQNSVIYAEGASISTSAHRTLLTAVLEQDGALDSVPGVSAVEPGSIVSFETFDHLASPDKSSRNKVIAIVVGSVIGVIVITLIVIVVYYCLARERAMNRRLQDASTEYSIGAWERKYGQYPSPAFHHWQTDQRRYPASNLGDSELGLRRQQQWQPYHAPNKNIVDWSLLRGISRDPRRVDHNGVLHRQQNQYEKKQNGFYWLQK